MDKEGPMHRVAFLVWCELPLHPSTTLNLRDMWEGIARGGQCSRYSRHLNAPGNFHSALYKSLSHSSAEPFQTAMEVHRHLPNQMVLGQVGRAAYKGCCGACCTYHTSSLWLYCCCSGHLLTFSWNNWQGRKFWLSCMKGLIRPPFQVWISWNIP